MNLKKIKDSEKPLIEYDENQSVFSFVESIPTEGEFDVKYPDSFTSDDITMAYEFWGDLYRDHHLTIDTRCISVEGNIGHYKVNTL